MREYLTQLKKYRDTSSTVSTANEFHTAVWVTGPVNDNWHRREDLTMKLMGALSIE